MRALRGLRPGIVMDGPGDATTQAEARDLQRALNRWALWLGVAQLKVDGIIGTKTFNFTRQVVAAFGVGGYYMWAAFFGRDAFILSPADLASQLSQFTADLTAQLDADADRLGIDTSRATPEDRAAATAKIAETNASYDPSTWAAGWTALPAEVTGGGTPKWVLYAGVGAAAVGATGLVALLVSKHRA